MKNALLKLCLALLFIASMFFSSGCCTIMRNQIKKQTPIVAYPATIMDVGIIGMSVFSKQGPPVFGDGKAPFWARPVFFIGGLIDLPISLVTDTILLPYDLVTRKKKKTDAGKPPDSPPPDDNPAQNKSPP